MNEGYEKAVNTMLNYRKSCKRDDFSPIWVAIPLVKMEYLRANTHVLDEDYVLPIKDKYVLQQLLVKYKNDPYVNFAHYYLHHFNVVEHIQQLNVPFTDKPSSKVGNHETDYIHHQINIAPASEQRLLTDIANAGACSGARECYLVAQWFPNSKTARGMLVSAVSDVWGKVYKNPDTAYNQLKEYRKAVVLFADKSTSKNVKKFVKEYVYILDTLNRLSITERHKFMPIYASGRCEEIQLCLVYLNKFNNSEKSEKIMFRELEDLVYAGDFNGFVGFADRVPGNLKKIVSTENKPFLNNIRNIYVDLIYYFKRKEIEKLLELAIEIRGRFKYKNDKNKAKPNYPYLASIIFSYISENHPGTTVGEKAHFLLCTVSARRIGISFAERNINEFIHRYPNSQFIDDAYAEMGLLKIKQGDRDAAKYYFDKVWKEYPTHNAADNALYHLASMAVNKGEYTKAMYYYGKIALHYGNNRLGKIANNSLSVLEGSYKAIRDRLELTGLNLSFYGEENYVAFVDSRISDEGKKIEVNDKLVFLNDKKVVSEAVFRSILSRYSVGSTIPAVFQRSVETDNGEKRPFQYNVNLKIGQASVFDVTYVDYDDTLTIRSQPNHTSKKIGEIPYDGTCIRYQETSAQGDKNSPWFKVKYRQKSGKIVSGWVNAHYLRKSRKCTN